ncbi:MAG: UvrD-helicase domain-containing protein [Defluviitaleaceae bacterium]|nr:UvrD-helicase domain-containing protein [Defluviitaleaceae bacterium]
MAKNFLDDLNPMQREAAAHTEGPLLIFAGAGSGKTRVLTYRIARLIELGIDPFNIIAITFTNKAAREMRERVNRINPKGSYVWVSTFHSTCVRLLRREINMLGYGSGFSIFDAQDSERLVKACVAELGLDEKLYQTRFVANAISGQKNELIGPTEFARASSNDYRMSNVADVYELYQRKLRACNALDFDDIILLTVRLFEEFPEILEKYQERFRYVLVDEYQDTNTAQYRLVNQLSGWGGNLCVVGDDDQSIYGWRGANIRNILRFEEDYPQARTIKLEQNYRSTGTILGAANAVIKNNRNRSEKKLWTENASGSRVKLYKAGDEGDEGAFVAETVKNGVSSGASYGDYAVLYRNNSQSRAIEDRLVLSGVPYRLYGGVRFYERKEVKDILSYLKAIENPSDDLAFVRIINVPRRGIGEASIAKLSEYAADTGQPLYAASRDAEGIPQLKNKARPILDFVRFLDDCAEFAKDGKVSDLLRKILEETDYLENLRDGTDEGENRIQNAQEFLSKAVEFEEGSDGASLGSFLEEVALVADIDNFEEGADAVSLLTLHSAKGLEFDTVFIVGAEENIFPSTRSVNGADPEGLEEERRLCYVGFTRAKRELYVTHALSRVQYGASVRNAVSRFVKEVPLEFVENVRDRQNARPQTRKSGFGGEGGATETYAAVNKNEFAEGFSRKSPAAFSNTYASGAAGRAIGRRGGTYKAGDKVKSPAYGRGLVIAVRDKNGEQDQELSVAFEGAGVKKFIASLANFERE